MPPAIHMAPPNGICPSSIHIRQISMTRQAPALNPKRNIRSGIHVDSGDP
jgi:hypothetical protein